MCCLIHLSVSYFHIFAMTERIKQRHCIEFCVGLNDSEPEAIRKLQKVFKDNSMRVAVFKSDYITILINSLFVMDRRRSSTFDGNLSIFDSLKCVIKIRAKLIELSL